MNILSAFGGYSVNDIDAAQKFYSETLGLSANIDSQMHTLDVKSPEGGHVFIYPKPDHQPAAFTVFNLVVSDIDAAADELISKGVQLEKYEGFNQDEKGIARPKEAGQGPHIGWFKDPAGNIISIIQS